MLKLTLLLLFVNTSFAMTSSTKREVEFWCTPEERLKGIESVLITKIKDNLIMEVYKPGTRWGSVSMESFNATVDTNVHYTFSSKNNKNYLSLFTDGQLPEVPGEIFNGVFTHPPKILNMKMSCEYLP